MNKDQIKGRAKQTGGKIKEVTGKVINDKTLQTEGNIKKNIGKAQASLGDAQNDLKKRR